MTRSKDSGSADYLARLRQYPRLSGGLEHEKVRSLAERLELCDASWDAQTEDCRSGRLMEVVKSLSPNPEDAVLRAEATSRTSLAVLRALSTLDVRERYLVERRLMADLEEQLSLAEIGRRFCVSRERARQIEARAIRRLRAALAGSGATRSGWRHRWRLEQEMRFGSGRGKWLLAPTAPLLRWGSIYVNI